LVTQTLRRCYAKVSGESSGCDWGNSGIGLATAKLFRSEGARVVISGRDQQTLEEAAKVIGGELMAVRADVSKTGEIEMLFHSAVQKWGGIDILFANAGVGSLLPVADVTEAHFDEVFTINVRGLFFTIQKALPYLKRGSAIVLNASVADEIGLPGASVYSASKAAVRSFARTMTTELVDQGIRVNVVSPGPVPTAILHRNGLSQDATDRVMSFLVSHVPMKRAGTAEEVANAVLFLASSDSSYVAGVELNVDGGMGQV